MPVAKTAAKAVPVRKNVADVLGKLDFTFSIQPIQPYFDRLFKTSSWRR
jgi:hypothetical protein